MRRSHGMTVLRLLYDHAAYAQTAYRVHLDPGTPPCICSQSTGGAPVAGTALRQTSCMPGEPARERSSRGPGAFVAALLQPLDRQEFTISTHNEWVAPHQPLGSPRQRSARPRAA